MSGPIPAGGLLSAFQVGYVLKRDAVCETPELL